MFDQDAQSGESAHTESIYTMYPPRSPASLKQVRFKPPIDNAPPLPPHAIEALAEARRKGTSLSPHFFHGPPPLHGDDVLPPPYKGAGADDGKGSRPVEKGFGWEGGEPRAKETFWRR